MIFFFSLNPEGVGLIERLAHLFKAKTFARERTRTPCKLRTRTPCKLRTRTPCKLRTRILVRTRIPGEDTYPEPIIGFHHYRERFARSAHSLNITSELKRLYDNKITKLVEGVSGL